MRICARSNGRTIVLRQHNPVSQENVQRCRDLGRADLLQIQLFKSLISHFNPALFCFFSIFQIRFDTIPDFPTNPCGFVVGKKLGPVFLFF